MPFTKKLTVSSRCPAVLKANDPWPRRGAVKNPFCGGVTVPGVSRLRSTKWRPRSEEHTSELQSRLHLVCRLLLEKKKKKVRLLHLRQSFNVPIRRGVASVVAC